MGLSAYMEFLKNNMHEPAAVAAVMGAPGGFQTQPTQFQPQQALSPQAGKFNYMDFLRMQAAANMDLEKKLQEQHDRDMHMQQQLDNMKLSRNGPSVTDPEAAMRLPTTAPPKFNGVHIDSSR